MLEWKDFVGTDKVISFLTALVDRPTDHIAEPTSVKEHTEFVKLA